MVAKYHRPNNQHTKYYAKKYHHSDAEILKLYNSGISFAQINKKLRYTAHDAHILLILNRNNIHWPYRVKKQAKGKGPVSNNNAS